ncbi:unnamed protein product [Tuber melanosporum]|jgi:hypothetical protein|uniref:(Perigord truffle) hypothetical protein n=1 Tax=Tuber melanosporum (strain Mel28) TaxID=656061 RepID=D5GMH6_TUBMM|nr:uncharacterized protein GSTUM_00010732001 [Tuber melanosporum]CAZ85719.1 unnamed protein product [Tuber melanosporum]
MSGQQGQAMPSGPPYLPKSAGYGGRPNKSIDIPISSVFIAIFLILGVAHMRLFKINRSRGHLFVFSAVTFGFCMSRIVTFSMRIAWAAHPRNLQVAIAASVFIAAGVVLLFVVNLNFTQRLLRAYHPGLVGNRLFDRAFLAYYVSVVLVLVMVITTTVQSFNTLSTHTLNIDLSIRKFGIIYFAVFAFAPIPMLLIGNLIPSSTPRQNFGKRGDLTEKTLIVILASAILTLSTAFRAATFFMPRPPTDPGWFNSRASFYVFTPLLEVVVVILYIVAGVDQKFHVEGKFEQKWAAESGEKNVETDEKA